MPFRFSRPAALGIALLFATSTVASAFLLFSPSYDPDLLEGRWFGTYVYDDGSGRSYTWDRDMKDDGTVAITFNSFENGDLVREYTLHGTWEATPYQYTTFINEREENGQFVRRNQIDTYAHVELSSDTHIYEHHGSGTVYTAERIGD